MGIGAADPDSTMIVQTIDAKGEVITSYLRNPKKIYEILVVKGDASVGKIPPKNNIIKKIDLRDYSL